MLNAVIIVPAVMLFACAPTSKKADINVPLAHSQVALNGSYEELHAAIDKFASGHRFAVQEVVTEPQGMVDFNVQLFRDDVRITINKLRNGQVELFVYPLCSCEMNRAPDLMRIADSEILALKTELVAR